MDSTGMEDRQTSHHFRKRRDETAQKKKSPKTQGKTARTAKPAKKNKKSSFPKLSVLCDCQSHMTLSFYADRGPFPDYQYFKPLLDDASKIARIPRLLCDAGYDSEPNHLHARQQHDTVAIMPAISGRPSPNPPKEKHRHG